MFEEEKKSNLLVCFSSSLEVLDDAFSTGTGLERAGIVGPVRCLWTLGSSRKTRNKKNRRGLSRCLSDA